MLEVYALLTELLYCCYFYTDFLTFYSSPYFLKCFPHFFLFFPHFSFALFAHFHFFSSPLTRFCSRHFLLLPLLFCHTAYLFSPTLVFFSCSCSENSPVFDTCCCVQGIRKFAADAIVLEGILREELKQ